MNKIQTSKICQVLFAFLLICSCKAQVKSDTPKQSEESGHPFSFVLEYPITAKGAPSNLYKIIQNESSALKLDSLQGGYDSLQIRFWFENTSDSLSRIIVIKKREGKYDASLISYSFREDGTLSQVISKELSPKSGFQTLMNSLADLKILTLPHMSNIPGFNVAWADGELYSVEVATKNQYRFYYYWCPEMLEAKYWQAGNMKKILEMLNSEFNLKLYKQCE